MYTSQYRFALLLDECNCQSNMDLSVSASRGLWPGRGCGPQRQRLRLTAAVHSALGCTSNCPDISLNWANALPALQSAMFSLSLHPPGPNAWSSYLLLLRVYNCNNTMCSFCIRPIPVWVNTPSLVKHLPPTLYHLHVAGANPTLPPLLPCVLTSAHHQLLTKPKQLWLVSFRISFHDI